MKHLCDVNFWVALAMGSHSKHEIARGWFEKIDEADSMLFCRPTQQGFLRLISDKSLFRDEPVTNREAWVIYRELRRDSRVGWLDEPAGIEALWMERTSLASHSPKVWMDGYLAAFAQLGNARLVTFDQGFRAYKGLDWIDLNQLK
jgi:toxin-antitoxin system PIN domain toxin